MRALSLCNGVGGIARVFGFPLPTVPEEVRSNIQDSVDIFKQESSVEAFGSLEEVVTDLTDNSEKKEAKQTVRGESLRQLLMYLESEIQNQNFAGLNRYPDPETGRAIWTRLKTREEKEEALETISRKRWEEEAISAKNKENTERENKIINQEDELLKKEISGKEKIELENEHLKKEIGKKEKIERENERLKSQIEIKEQENECLKGQLSSAGGVAPEQAQCCVII